MESALLAGLQGGTESRAGAAWQSLSVAINADSVASWFLPGVATLLQRHRLLLEIMIDDQDHTHDALKSGDVIGCVTTLAQPMRGCVAEPLGIMRYRCVAAPAVHVYLNQQQVAEIARHADHEGTRDAIWLAATTGLRRGELLALRPEHYRDGALWLATSKSGRPRRVPVPADARYICDRLPLAVTVVALRKDFNRARRKAGLADVRFHDLRHTFASWAIDAGVDLRLLKDLMGHSTMQMTSRYAHLEDRHHDQAMRRMARKRKPVPRT